LLTEKEKKGLISIFRKFDINTLIDLAGKPVVRIVKNVIDRGAERSISEVIVQRYDDQVFAKKSIRRAFIDSLPSKKLEEAAEKLNIKHAFSSNIGLKEYFNNWSVVNSKEFVDAFDLSSKFTKRPPNPKSPVCEIISLEYGESLSSSGQLHPYQKTVKDQVNTQLMYTDKRELVVQMPTGAGKTFTMLESIVDILRTKPKNTFMFWIVNSNELARQSHEAFKKLWRQKGDQSIHSYRYYDALSPVNLDSQSGIAFGSFSTINSLLNGNRKEAKLVLKKIASSTHTLVIDEAHSSPAETYADCISYFQKHNLQNLVGLTATPGREDKTGLDELVEMFQQNIIQINDVDGKPIPNVVRYLQKNEYLAELDVHLLETDVIAKQKGPEKICKFLAEDPNRNRKIIERVKKYVEEEKSTLLFACTKDHVFALYVLCKYEGIECEFIVGETSNSKREEILQRFKHKKFLVLINLNILETGIDVPSLDHVFITRPVGSSISYSQIIGRALRGPKNGGKKKNEITTLIDNIESHTDEQVLFKNFWSSWGI